MKGLRNLRCKLLIFEAATGMKVNWSKSAISPVGEVLEIEMMTNVISYEVVPLPTSYLGLPLGVKASSIDTWNLVLKKVGSKLAN